VGAAQQVGSQAGAAQQVGSQHVGSQQVGSQQLEPQHPPLLRLKKPAWASFAKHETAPATSNMANKIFAFMGVLKKQERDVLFLAERPTPFKRTCDQILLAAIVKPCWWR
jgi:hypothetical protein